MDARNGRQRELRVWFDKVVFACIVLDLRTSKDLKNSPTDNEPLGMIVIPQVTFKLLSPFPS